MFVIGQASRRWERLAIAAGAEGQGQRQNHEHRTLVNSEGEASEHRASAHARRYDVTSERTHIDHSAAARLWLKSARLDGDPIKLSSADFERPSAAFFTELEKRFLQPSS